MVLLVQKINEERESNRQKKPKVVLQHEYENSKLMLTSLRPDFMFVEEFKQHLVYAWFLLEIEKDLTFDKRHKINMRKYNEEILLSNPCREFVVSILTNLNCAMLFWSKREKLNDDTCSFIHEQTVTFSFWDQGLYYIERMLKDPRIAGYEDDKNFSVEIIDET